MNKNNYCVYCHISPSGKRYYGVTSRKPEKRWNHGLGYNDSSYFFRAIQKYGWDAFEHIILHQGLTWGEASNLEKRYIALYDTTNRSKGYNIEPGGLKCDKRLSEETKKKIGDSHRGRFTEAQREAVKTRRNPNYHHSDEIKKIIGDFHRGKPLSEEHRKKLSVAHKGIRPSNLKELRECNMKKVIKCAPDGENICVYNSIKEAGEINGISPQCISNCCRGRLKTAGGYIWRYAI